MTNCNGDFILRQSLERTACNHIEQMCIIIVNYCYVYYIVTNVLTDYECMCLVWAHVQTRAAETVRSALCTADGHVTNGKLNYRNEVRTEM